MADQEKPQVPDLYSDLFNIYENALGVILLLHRSDPPERQGTNTVQKAQMVATLRFSPENWKVILMTGRKQLKAREAALGAPIKLPEELLKGLSITEADW